MLAGRGTAVAECAVRRLSFAVAETDAYRRNGGFLEETRMFGRRMFTSCAICAVIGLVADDASAQAPTGLKRTITARHDGPAEGYETLEVLVEIEPNFVVDWHIHPGTEAGYTLEGGGELLVKGEAAQMTKPGSSWVIAQANPHTLKNGSQAPKLAITYTVEKGKPLATPVPAPA